MGPARQAVGSAARPRAKEPALCAPGEPLTLPHRCLLAIAFMMIGLLAARQVGSLDIGFHLKAGEHILAGKGWPRTDPFTFTLSDRPYIDTSWGYQVVVSLIQRWLDAPGLVVFHAALVLGVFFILYRTARLTSVDPTSLVALLAVGGVAAEMRYETRPELASWLLLSLVLYILHRHAEGTESAKGRRSLLVLLPAIHLVWANTHSLFILGWGAMACFAAGLWLRDRCLDRRLLAGMGGAVVVTVINPYGWRGVLFPFTLATRLKEDNPFGQSIGEFVSPFSLGLSEQFPFYPRLPILAFQLLAVLAVISLVPLFRQRRFWCCLLCLAFLPLAAGMIRNIPLLVIACLPGIAWGLPAGRVLEAIRLRQRTRRVVAGGALAALAVATLLLSLRVIQDSYYIASRRVDRFGLGWNQLTLPIEAARYADRVGLRGPMLNHLNFGGFLMWARPQPVFIDGRLEVVGERFYRYYQDALASEASLEACVSRYGIEWIIIPYATTPKLLARLSSSPKWRLAYSDHLAAVFVREGPQSGRFVDSARPPATPVDPGSLPGLRGNRRPGALARWARGLTSRQSFPSDSYYRGLFHYFRGEMEPAEASFSSALLESRGAYYEIYNNLGAVYYQRRKVMDAADCYRVVLTEDPDNRLARQRVDAISSGVPAPREGG